MDEKKLREKSSILFKNYFKQNSFISDKETSNEYPIDVSKYFSKEEIVDLIKKKVNLSNDEKTMVIFENKYLKIKISIVKYMDYWIVVYNGRRNHLIFDNFYQILNDGDEIYISYVKSLEDKLCEGIQDICSNPNFSV